MSFRQSRRFRGDDPALLRQLRGEPAVSIVDRPPQPWELAFCAAIVATMVVTTAAMIAL